MRPLALRLAGCLALLIAPGMMTDPLAAAEPFPAVIVCDGNGTLNAQAMRTLREMGVEAINFDIAWKDIEPTKGTFVWEAVDAYIAQARQADMPLYAGIALHYIPDWLMEEDLGLVNQYGQSSFASAYLSRRYPSMWDPRVKAYFARVIQAIGERYGDTFPAVYVAAGGLGEMQLPGGPIPGDTHGSFAHFWAFDPAAIKSYRHYLQTRYDSVDAYNHRAGTSFESFDAVEPPRTITEGLNNVDFIDWLHGSIKANAKFLAGHASAYWQRIGIKHNIAFGWNRLFAVTGSGPTSTQRICEINQELGPDIEVFPCWGMMILPASWYGAKIAHRYETKFMTEHAILDLPAALTWSKKANIDCFSYFHAGSLFSPDNKPLPKLDEFRWFLGEWLAWKTRQPLGEKTDALSLTQAGGVLQVDHPAYRAVLGSDYPAAGCLMSLRARRADGTVGPNPLVGYSPAAVRLEGVLYSQFAGSAESAPPKLIEQTPQRIVIETAGALRNSSAQSAGWTFVVRYGFSRDSQAIAVTVRLSPPSQGPAPRQVGTWLLSWPAIADAVTADYAHSYLGADGVEQFTPAHFVAIEGKELDGLAQLNAQPARAMGYTTGVDVSRDTFEGLGFPSRQFPMWISPPSGYFVKQVFFGPPAGETSEPIEYELSLRVYDKADRYRTVAKARPIELWVDEQAMVLTPYRPSAEGSWVLWNRSGQARTLQLRTTDGSDVSTQELRLEPRCRKVLTRTFRYDPARPDKDARMEVLGLAYPLESTIRVTSAHRIEANSPQEKPFIHSGRSFVRGQNLRYTDRDATICYRFEKTHLPKGLIRIKVRNQYRISARAEGADAPAVSAESQERTSFRLLELDVSGLLETAEAVILEIGDADTSDGYGAMWEYIELE